jgi:hypothetical protein
MATTPVRERVRRWREKQKQVGGKTVSIVLKHDAAEELDDIRQMTNLKTIADVINESISVFKSLVEKEKQGFEIYIIPPKQRKEVPIEKIVILTT